MITLAVPTRDRPDRFQLMVDSVNQTTEGTVEVIAWRDVDDHSRYPRVGNVTYHVGDRPAPQEMASLWNKAWAQGSGDIVMLAADDIRFETTGWDRRVAEAFDRFPDRLGMVYANNLSDPRPVLPFVSRAWTDAIGFVPNDLPGWFADEHIWSIASELGRVIFLEDVVIEHHQFGSDQTYADAMLARAEVGGLEGMRRRFYSIPEVERRDVLVGKLRTKMEKCDVLAPVPRPQWQQSSLELAAGTRYHRDRMRQDTLVVVHCYKGDRALVQRHMPLYQHHGSRVLVLSPEDSPVKLRGVECQQAGKAAYYGQDSLDRQRAHLRILAERPETYFLLNDADSFCLSPEIPRYLFEQADKVWSNEVEEWRPHSSPYPKIGMHPPYFLRRDTIQRMLRVADRPEVQAHPITPYIDWFMVALTCEANLEHDSYPDGFSFPAWRYDWIPDTQTLGHDYKHKYVENGRMHGDDIVEKQVARGAVMIHSVKHKQVYERLLKAHEKFVHSGAPLMPNGQITMEDYVEANPTQVRESYGFVEGDTVRIQI